MTRQEMVTCFSSISVSRFFHPNECHELVMSKALSKSSLNADTRSSQSSAGSMSITGISRKQLSRKTQANTLKLNNSNRMKMMSLEKEFLWAETSGKCNDFELTPQGIAKYMCLFIPRKSFKLTFRWTCLRSFCRWADSTLRVNA